MIMTDSGFGAIEASSHGPLYRVMSWLGFVPRTEPQGYTDTPLMNSFSSLPPVPSTLRGSHADSAKLAERYASNALVYAGVGGFAEAESFFREAFTLDRKLSPDALSNFWQLPRAAHEAAKNALMAVGRDDDAVALAREINDREMIAAHPELQRAAS